MTRSDLTVLTNYLRALYGERFPGLTPSMAQLWYDDLQALDSDLVTRAVRRWARQHTLKAPTLDELVEVVEWLEDQDRRSRLPAAPANPITVLAEALARRKALSPEYTTADSIFGKLMIRLLDCATRHEGRYTLTDCAAQCLTWAQYYLPKSAELAQWLDAQAVQYERLAQRVGATAPVVAWPTTRMAALGDARAAQAPEEPCLHEHVGSDNSCNDCGDVLARHVA